MTYDYRAETEDEVLTQGVITRRIFAWLIDALLIGCAAALVWMLCAAFSILTLGLGWPIFGVLAFVPFAYNFLFLVGRSATPGQSLFGLTVRDNAGLEPPTAAQALVFTILYYVTLATSGLLFLFALFTVRKRALHDLLSGLVVVRTRALTATGEVWNMPAGSLYR